MRDRPPTPPGLFGRNNSFAARSAQDHSEFITSVSLDKETTSSLADNSDSGNSLDMERTMEEYRANEYRQNTPGHNVAQPRYGTSLAYQENPFMASREETGAGGGFESGVDVGESLTQMPERAYHHPAPLLFEHQHPFLSRSSFLSSDAGEDSSRTFEDRHNSGSAGLSLR